MTAAGGNNHIRHYFNGARAGALNSHTSVTRSSASRRDRSRSPSDTSPSLMEQPRGRSVTATDNTSRSVSRTSLSANGALFTAHGVTRSASAARSNAGAATLDSSYTTATASTESDWSSDESDTLVNFKQDTQLRQDRARLDKEERRRDVTAATSKEPSGFARQEVFHRQERRQPCLDSTATTVTMSSHSGARRMSGSPTLSVRFAAPRQAAVRSPPCQDGRHLQAPPLQGTQQEPLATSTPTRRHSTRQAGYSMESDTESSDEEIREQCVHGKTSPRKFEEAPPLQLRVGAKATKTSQATDVRSTRHSVGHLARARGLDNGTEDTRSRRQSPSLQRARQSTQERVTSLSRHGVVKDGMTSIRQSGSGE